MPKPFDATIKDLAALGPADFVSRFAGPTTLPVQLLNVDLSTVTTAADVVFGIGEPLAEILHLDAQASASATKHLDVLAYNALLHRAYLGDSRHLKWIRLGGWIRRRVSPNQQAVCDAGTHPRPLYMAVHGCVLIQDLMTAPACAGPSSAYGPRHRCAIGCLRSIVRAGI
ncbi:MAG: hypothetical protein R6U98_26505 [Pirellulaceae bacterium]